MTSTIMPKYKNFIWKANLLWKYGLNNFITFSQNVWKEVHKRRLQVAGVDFGSASSLNMHDKAQVAHLNMHDKAQVAQAVSNTSLHS